MKYRLKILINVLVVVILLIPSFSYADNQMETEAIGRLLAISINKNDYSAINKKFDADGFITLVADKLMVPQNQRADFNKGMMMSVSHDLIKKIVVGSAGGVKNAKYIGLIAVEDSLRPVVRVVYNNGTMNFIGSKIARKNNEIKFVDLYISAVGMDMSDFLKQDGLLLLKQPTDWVAQLVDQSLVDERYSQEIILKILQQAMLFKRQGNMRATYEKLQELPEPIKHNEQINVLIMEVASLFNQEFFLKELEKFVIYHDDNQRFAFVLSSYYLHKGKYDEALSVLNNDIERYQQDASLLILRANILMIKKDYAAVYQEIDRALKKEPDYEDAYWVAVVASMNEHAFDKTVSWFTRLESQFGHSYSDENFVGDEIYKGFVSSKPYNTWIKSKAK